MTDFFWNGMIVIQLSFVRRLVAIFGQLCEAAADGITALPGDSARIKRTCFETRCLIIVFLSMD